MGEGKIGQTVHGKGQAWPNFLWKRPNLDEIPAGDFRIVLDFLQRWAGLVETSMGKGRLGQA